MKKLKELLEKKWFAYTFAASFAVILYVMLTHFEGIGNFFAAFKNVVSPVICGIILAYLMNPLANYFERKWFGRIKKEKSRHSLAVVTTVLIVIVAIVLLFVALVPSMIDSITVLVSNAPSYLENLANYFDKIAGNLSKIGIDASNIEKSLEESLYGFFETIPDNMGKVLSTSVSVGSSLFNLVSSWQYISLPEKKVLRRDSDVFVMQFLLIRHMRPIPRSGRSATRFLSDI